VPFIRAEIVDCERKRSRAGAAAASAVADLERRVGKFETLVSLNTAVLAMNTAPGIAVAGRPFQFF
jgi:hypothetical protein